MGFTWVSLELTNLCNMSCPMCCTMQFRQSESESLLSREDIRQRILTPAKKVGASGFVISGGEPTLSDHLLDVVEDAKTLGFRIVLASNALKETKYTFNEILCALDSPLHVYQFSFDSIHETQMNRIRGGNVHKKVMHNLNAIKEIKEENSLSVNLHSITVVQQENMDSVEETVDFLHEKLRVDCCVVQPRVDYSYVTLENYREKGRGIEEDELREKFIAAASTLFSLKPKYPRLHIVGETVENWEKFYRNPLSLHGPCASTGILFVDAFGNIRGCLSGVSSCNIRTVSLDAYMASQGYAKHQRLAKACRICINGCSW
nr:radical SAM protein [Desulfobacula sp.]